MSDTVFRNDIDYKARVRNCSKQKLISDFIDEVAIVRLTHSNKTLGGAAEIIIGPLTLSFNRVVDKGDELHIKGPMGRTVAHIETGTDLADNMLRFVCSHDDITYRSEQGDRSD